MSNKGLKITIIVILFLLLISITIFFVKLLMGKEFNFSFSTTVSDKLVLDNEYENSFSEIKIDTDAANVVVLNSSDDKVKLKVYGKKKDVTVLESSVLKIDVKQECKGFCINQKISKIEIYLPSDYNKKLTIKNNYGDIKIANFDNMLLNAKLNCGDIKIDSIYDAIIKNNYGDIKIDRVYNYVDLSDDCGDIKIDELNINKDSIIEDNLGNIKINKTNEIYIDGETDLGDVKVNKNYRHSDITLKISNDCGDIKVN